MLPCFTKSKVQNSCKYLFLHCALPRYPCGARGLRLWWLTCVWRAQYQFLSVIQAHSMYNTLAADWVSKRYWCGILAGHACCGWISKLYFVLIIDHHAFTVLCGPLLLLLGLFMK